jgi:RimJ/RimL family protein N-acetyltransferase
MREADLTSDSELVTSYLRERVESLPPDLLEDISSPIRPKLAHGPYQALLFAVQSVAPHISRDAFDAGFTGADLVAWLAPVLKEGRPEQDHRAERPPRGSYTSDNVTLRPIAPPDVDALYFASLDPRASHRWRFRGRTPAPNEFRDNLFDPGVLAQFMVAHAETGEAVGLVSSYQASMVGKHCFVAFQRLRREAGPTSGLMIEGLLIFVQYLFDHFDLRKVYFEVPEYNATLFSRGPGALVEEEGRFKDHFYYGDRMWDLLTFALYRTRWESVADGFRGVWPEGHFDRG